MSGGQNYLLLVMDIAKVGGPLSAVKVCTSMVCIKIRRPHGTRGSASEKQCQMDKKEGATTDEERKQRPEAWRLQFGFADGGAKVVEAWRLQFGTIFLSIQKAVCRRSSTGLPSHGVWNWRVHGWKRVPRWMTNGSKDPEAWRLQSYFLLESNVGQGQLPAEGPVVL